MKARRSNAGRCVGQKRSAKAPRKAGIRNFFLSINGDFSDRPPPPETEDREGFDRFGFIAYDVGCVFDGGEIAPVANHQEVAAWVEEHTYRPNLVAPSPTRDWRWESRVFFPPIVYRGAMDPRDCETGAPAKHARIANSTRPAEVHRVPVSHHIRADGVSNNAAARESNTAFLTKTFGFLFDSPTQFHDWWFDGVVSIGERQLHPLPTILADFLSCSYATWLSWLPDEQQAMIAILKMHGRAPGHQWYWERFAWEYSVTDACYRLAKAIGRLKATGKAKNHRGRIEAMVRAFRLSCASEESEWINLIICLRNELIHEARWARNQPSTKTPDGAFYAAGILHQLNQRIITACLGYANNFVGSPWARGRGVFHKA